MDGMKVTPAAANTMAMITLSPRGDKCVVSIKPILHGEELSDPCLSIRDSNPEKPILLHLPLLRAMAKKDMFLEGYTPEVEPPFHTKPEKGRVPKPTKQ